MVGFFLDLIPLHRLNAKSPNLLLAPVFRRTPVSTKSTKTLSWNLCKNDLDSLILSKLASLKCKKSRTLCRTFIFVGLPGLLSVILNGGRVKKKILTRFARQFLFTSSLLQASLHRLNAKSPDFSFCWVTWIRTKTDRIKICSATVTP